MSKTQTLALSPGHIRQKCKHSPQLSRLVCNCKRPEFMPLAVDSSHLYLLRLHPHTFRKPWGSAALEANKVGRFCECCLTFITGAQTLLSKPYHNNQFMTVKAFTFNSIQLTKAFQNGYSLTIDLLHSKNEYCRALQCPSFKHCRGDFPSCDTETNVNAWEICPTMHKTAQDNYSSQRSSFQKS